MEDESKNNSNLRELVELAKRGDNSAFTELHKTFVGAIYRFAFMSLGDKDKAEDITQEVFIKAWGALPNYIEKGRPFSAWLYRMAKNAIIDLSRKKKNVSLDNLPETEHPESWKDSPSIVIQEKEVTKNLMAVVGRLTEEQKEVIIFKFMEGYSNKEIAKMTNKSEVAVRQMQCRALKALRNLLIKNE